MSGEQPQMELEESQDRVLYSLMLGSVRLAKLFGKPLKDVVGLLQMAYFHELRSDGLSLEEIGQVLEVSRRTAARLSKQLKTNFFRPEREHELPRRVEFLLWAEPMSQARILRELSVDPEELEEALAQLQEEGRVVLEPGRVPRYAVARLSDRLVRPGWTARIGALNSLVGNLTDVVQGRFFAQSPTSFARTLTLRVRPQDMPELRRLYEEQIWPALEALDKEAAGDSRSLEMRVSLCWAEYETSQRQEALEPGEES